MTHSNSISVEDTNNESELDELQKQIWDAATLNADNSLGHRLLDAHFAEIRRWRDSAVVEARIDECENTTVDADERVGYKDTYKEDRLQELKAMRKIKVGQYE